MEEWKHSKNQGRQGPCSHGAYILAHEEKQIEKQHNCVVTSALKQTV